ncbi:MAG: nucleotidyltransferase family protein, partial [Planctomycetes bacterium]|nr:nucleotidyltransferase family protein [Planctomycetota bacterium]
MLPVVRERSGQGRHAHSTGGRGAEVIRGISAEDRFVLGCLRGYLGDLRRVECGGLNWAEVERKIEAQRVGGAVFQGLQRVGAASSVPTALIGRLQADYYKTAGRVLEMTEEARRVLRAFQERGIEAILLKGMFLANQVYDTPGVRPMGDVDLLVRERHLPNAESIMLRLGYKQVREVMPE